MKILLIEDNPGDLYIISGELALLDDSLELMVIDNGETAIMKLREFEEHPELGIPDLVIMDSCPAPDNCFEILKSMQGNKNMEPDSVIIYSDILEQAFNWKVLELGVSGVFSKTNNLPAARERIRIIANIARSRFESKHAHLE